MLNAIYEKDGRLLTENEDQTGAKFYSGKYFCGTHCSCGDWKRTPEEAAASLECARGENAIKP